MGTNLPGTMNPLLRFYFTSQTAPIDVCAPYSSPSAEALNPASPGVGQREAVGLGVPVPQRSTGLP